MAVASDLWIERVGRPLALSLMVGCVGLSGVALGERLASGWDGTYLLLFCSATALGTYFSYRVFRHAPHRGWLLLVEWILLFAALQLCVDVSQGLPLFAADGLPTVQLVTLGLYVPVALTREFIRLTVQDLERLQEAPYHDPHLVPQHRLGNRIFGVGVVLFLVGGLTQDQVATVLQLPKGGSGPILNVLLYFVLGTLFLAQVHYAALRGRWRNQNIAVAPQLSRSWLLYTLVFVGAIGMTALLLSATASHASGVAAVGRTVWDPTLRAAVRSGAISKHLLLQLLKMFGGSTDLFRGARPTGTITVPRNLHIRLPPLPAHTPQIAHGAKHGAHGGGWLNLIARILFWVALAGALLFLVRTALRRSPRTRGAAMRIDGIFSALRGAWTALWRWLRRQTGLPVRPFSRARGDKSGGVDGDSARSRRGHSSPASPREQILWYYLSMVKEAARKGVRRESAQTPAEYRNALSVRVPEATDDVSLLTDAFVEARYSVHEVEAAQALQARDGWSRVRAALRHIKA